MHDGWFGGRPKGVFRRKEKEAWGREVIPFQLITINHAFLEIIFVIIHK